MPERRPLWILLHCHFIYAPAKRNKRRKQEGEREGERLVILSQRLNEVAERSARAWIDQGGEAIYWRKEHLILSLCGESLAYLVPNTHPFTVAIA